jgi:hypothetical protein
MGLAQACEAGMSRAVRIVATTVLAGGIALSSAGALAEGPATWLLVIVGVGGDEAHRAKFSDLAQRMVAAATDRLAVPAENVRLLLERTELAPDAVDGRSTREQIEATIAEVGAAASPGDRVLLLLIGHGNGRGDETFFNLPGPDMSAGDFDALLALLADQDVAVVNTASASGGFTSVLSGPGRTIVTATRSVREAQEPVFAEHFVDAFAEEGADTDKDGRISLLEAFVYADAEVARFYESEGLIRTEHARLEDDGDGEGTGEPGGDVGDGARARRFALGAPVAGLPAGEELGAAQRALLTERAELEASLERLRASRETMTDTEYEDRLEELLVRIAEIDRLLREGGEQ